MVAAVSQGPGALLDSVYKSQRHIYDLTRKYYLFGRDTLIAGLGAKSGMRVLEIACGTGRNLAKVRKAWTGVRLYGLDISAEMLKNARRTLGDSATLGLGDACSFAPDETFGEAGLADDGFDRVILSYALSMIPDWEDALGHAASQLASGGELHIVDFGELGGLPGPLRTMLHLWLARFHVEAREDMPAVAAKVAAAKGLTLTSTRRRLGYFQLHVLRA